MTELDRAKVIYRSCAAMVGLPYIEAGGHNTAFAPSLGYAVGIGAKGAGVDCSGGVGIALKAAGRLWSPPAPFPPSTGGLMSYGIAGPGRYVTLHVCNFPPPGEEHCALQFSINEPGYEEQWWQAANPKLGVGWYRLSNTEIAEMLQRHWPSM